MRNRSCRTRDLVDFGSAILQGTPSPRLDAELLLCHAAEISRVQLISRWTDDLGEQIGSRYRQLIERRARREPLAYITGIKEFWGLDFKVDPRVLIPRPETELLVERALRWLRSIENPQRAIDLGTGSGIIPVCLALELRNSGIGCGVEAVDESPGALEVASQNAYAHGVGEAIDFRRGDWFSAVPEGARYALIVSNPPYVSPEAQDTSPEIAYEPAGALFAESGGMSDIERIIRDAPDYLASEAALLLEIGSDQAEKVTRAFEASASSYALDGFRVSFSVEKDLAGLPRLAVVERRKA